MIVTDDYPAFFVPAMLTAAGRTLAGIRLEAIDSNGLFPMRAPGRSFSTAALFDRKVVSLGPDVLIEGYVHRPH